MIKVTGIKAGDNVAIDFDGEGCVYPASMFPGDIKIGDELDYNTNY